ncbi:MAG: shikimate dehydrogenase [Solirubrobacteraceae bacterium]
MRAGRLGVIGWPVAHSRSPAMQQAAFAELGLDGWSYQLLPVPPELFAETVRALPAAGFVGANVTVPHKRSAFELADSASASARAIGAANTLLFDAAGRIHAENTDAPGLIEALPFDVAGLRAVVLGAGGSGRSAAFALREAGARVAIWNRTPGRAQTLAEDLAVRAIERVEPADLLVNCTTVGLDEGSRGAQDALQALGLRADLVAGYAYVVDFVYARGGTQLLALAREHGVSVIDGIDILVAQGAISFELWTGLPAPRGAMARAAREDA